MDKVLGMSTTLRNTPAKNISKGDTFSSEKTAHEKKLCILCNEKGGWKTPLAPGLHGCGACHKTFDASVWPQTVLDSHKYKTTDLVCPECVTKGYSCNQYESHTCQVCKLALGHLKFNKQTLNNAKRYQTSNIICVDCQTKLQCAACLVAYDKTSWSVKERNNHITKDYKLVCKSCREKGRHPQDTKIYTCQKCKQ